MIERLVIPAWGTPPHRLEDWIARFETLGHRPVVVRDEGDTWLMVEPIGLRGFVLIDEGGLTALHFEIDDPDPTPALDMLQEAATGLGWEVHEESDEDED